MAWGNDGPSYGPKVEVAASDIEVAVSRTYRGEFRSPVMWRGKLTLFYKGSELLEIEGTLLESKQGGDPYVVPPQRAYEDQSGQTKYSNIAYFNAKPLQEALAQAVRMELGDSSTEADTPEEDGPPI